MALANTVEATIIADFEDRLSGPSKKTFDQFQQFASAMSKNVSTSLRALPGSLDVLNAQMFQVGTELIQNLSRGIFLSFDSVKNGIQSVIRELFSDEGASNVRRGFGNVSGGFSARNGVGGTFQDFPRPDRSFRNGILDVPRDMIARIHKGETVLPRAEAERFRGDLAGQNNITFHINGGFAPDRGTARKFARMIESERIRLNERKHR